MLKSLRIENFRCFKAFELQQLGQLNLLVGMNNSGKTSVLEAIQLLSSQTNLETLGEVMISRGEYILNDDRRGIRELDIRHLFYGHKIEVGSRFFISSENDNHAERVTFSVEDSGQLSLFENLRELVLIVEWLENEKEAIQLPLSPQESLPLDYIQRIRRDLRNPRVKSQFVTASSLTTEKMIELFDQVVLTPEESLVTASLQTIEPEIERMASMGTEKYRFGGRSGFMIKLASGDQRIPIGSMGDGIWRMLGLALAIVNAKNGILLVDEIDTGFHFSAMFKMWKLIWETAKRLNVQVFATTHNSDCWTSLAAIASTENPSHEGITIHRIEKEKPASVMFTERQVAIAAERGIEVR